MGKIIGIYNQKGGTGKTSTCINISAFLEESGFDVLAIDIDAGQGNFTSAMLSEEVFSDSNKTMYLSNILSDVSIETKNAIYPVSFQMKAKSKPKHVHIDMIPASKEEEKFYSSPFILRDKLNEVKNNYDFIIIDFPPERPYADVEKNEYNLVTLALCCANEILIPCTTDEDSLSGFFSLSDHIKLVRQKFNANLYRTSFFINSYTGYKAERDFLAYCETLKPAYSGICIPYSGILKTSRMLGRPLAWFNSSSNIALSYKSFTKYVSQ